MRAWLAVMAAMAMVLALLPAAPALAQDNDNDDPPDPTSRGIENVCPPPGVDDTEDHEFTDIEDNVHRDSIDCVAQYEIAQGFPDGTYRPGQNISRGQMATFIRNMVETGKDTTLEQPDEDQFTDIAGTTHQGNINAIANVGIVTGFDDGTYRPGRAVNRAQMSTFIVNAIDYIDNNELDGSAPPETDADFFDDDDGNAHEGNINRLAAQGIVAGVGDRRYNPGAPVRRGQMATFVMQGADFLDEIASWAPTAEPFVADLTLEPEEAANPILSEHTVTATAFDQFDGAFEGADVRFEVERDGELVHDGAETTDEEGEAEFTYEGPLSPSEDEITACTNEDGSLPEDCDEADLVATATKDWEAVPPPPGVDDLTLEPEEAENVVGTEHEVTATAMFEDEPAEGAIVRLEIIRDGELEDFGYGVTDEDGEVIFAYDGPDEPADDTLIACTTDEGAAPDDCDEEGLITAEATKTWVEAPPPFVAELTLEPETDANPILSFHTVTATAFDQFEGPYEGAEVRFEVEREGELVEEGQATTDEDGEADFTYQGPLTEATDTITACANEDGSPPDDCDEADIAATAVKSWEGILPPPGVDELTLEPEEDENPVGTQHEVTATAMFEDEPAEGAIVRFEVERDGEIVEEGYRVTDEDGEADFAYAGPDEAAEDTITACTTEDGTAADDCDEADLVTATAAKTWFEPPPPIVDDLEIDPEADTNVVETEHTVTATATLEGEPAEGVSVRIEVERDGEPVEVDPDSGATGADGTTEFTYEGPDEPAVDTIVVCANADGTPVDDCAEADLTAEGTKTWVEEEPEPATLELQPDEASNPPDAEDHTVTATVLDAGEDPFDGAEVRFEVYRDDTGDETYELVGVGHETTGDAGTAEFTYDGPEDRSQRSILDDLAADDIIVACVVFEDDEIEETDEEAFCAVVDDDNGLTEVEPRDDRPSDGAAKDWEAEGLLPI